MCVCMCVWRGEAGRGGGSRVTVNAVGLHYLSFMFLYFAHDWNSNFLCLQDKQNILDCTAFL